MYLYLGGREKKEEKEQTKNNKEKIRQESIYTLGGRRRKKNKNKEKTKKKKQLAELFIPFTGDYSILQRQMNIAMNKTMSSVCLEWARSLTWLPPMPILVGCICGYLVEQIEKSGQQSYTPKEACRNPFA